MKTEKTRFKVTKYDRIYYVGKCKKKIVKKWHEDVIVDEFEGTMREIYKHYKCSKAIIYRNKNTGFPNCAYAVEKVNALQRYYDFYDRKSNTLLYEHKTIKELANLLHIHPNCVYRFKKGTKKYIMR